MLEFLHTPNSAFDPVPNSTSIRLCSLSGLQPNKYTPSTYLEFLPVGEMPEVSDWHIPAPDNGLGNTSVLTIYPEEYSSWLGVKDRVGMVLSGKGIYEIIYPADNSIFFIDPGVPSSDQILKIESTGFSGKISSVYIV